MEKELIQKLFMKVRLDIYNLDVFAHNLSQESTIHRLQAGTLQSMAQKCACSAMALKCAMDGIAPPKDG